jgi:hypothetical protein
MTRTGAVIAAASRSGVKGADAGIPINAAAIEASS